MLFSNSIIKVYPANYPAMISSRSRIWPDSEKWPDIRPEPELSSGATLHKSQNKWSKTDVHALELHIVHVLLTASENHNLNNTTLNNVKSAIRLV